MLSNIYKLQNMNINFNDIESLKIQKSIKCNLKKLLKGQSIKLQSNSKLAILFEHVEYLAIYIKSNQNDTERTIINAIDKTINFIELKLKS